MYQDKQVQAQYANNIRSIIITVPGFPCGLMCGPMSDLMS